MFLKKVVSWISENPPDESLNEIITEESEKSLNESTETIKADDNWSSTGTRGETSTLEGCFVEQNEIIDIQLPSKEKAENSFATGDNGFVSITISSDKDDNTETETKKENTGCNQFMRERLSLITNSVANINLHDDAVIKREY